MPRLTMRQRCLIIWRLGQGISQRNIAAEIPCSQSTVSVFGKKWIRERVIEPQKLRGSPKNTTEEQDNRIIEVGIFSNSIL
jgi:transposase